MVKEPERPYLIFNEKDGLPTGIGVCSGDKRLAIRVPSFGMSVTRARELIRNKEGGQKWVEEFWGWYNA